MKVTRRTQALSTAFALAIVLGIATNCGKKEEGKTEAGVSRVRVMSEPAWETKVREHHIAESKERGAGLFKVEKNCIRRVELSNRQQRLEIASVDNGCPARTVFIPEASIRLVLEVAPSERAAGATYLKRNGVVVGEMIAETNNDLIISLCSPRNVARNVNTDRSSVCRLTFNDGGQVTGIEMLTAGPALPKVAVPPVLGKDKDKAKDEKKK